jgi:lysyl-tRNA synthetase class I
MTDILQERDAFDYSLDGFTSEEIVKAYTKLMIISEPSLVILMAQVNLNWIDDDAEFDVKTLNRIANSIKEWCENVKPKQTTFSVGENLENELCTIQVNEEDTIEKLIKAFLSNLCKIQSWDQYNREVRVLKH